MRLLALLIAALLGIPSAGAMGRGKVSPAPMASASPSVSVSPSPAPTLEVTADSLRENVLAGNNSILTELNQVYTAKDQRNKALTSLLPSVNLGVVDGTIANGPTFVLSSVQFLLPFLLPGNWINLRAQDHLLDAEMASYQLVELNQYASAFTLYETVINDLDAKDVLQENYDALFKLYQTLLLESQQTGTVSPTDVLQAKEKVEAAFVPLTDIQKVMKIDAAALRQAMGLDEKTVFVFPDRTACVRSADSSAACAHVPASDWETRDVQTVLDQALSMSPEKTQLASLLSAAQDGKWSTIFGFVTNNTLGTLPISQGSGPKTASFANMISQAQFSIGFTYASEIQLSEDNVDAIRLEQRDLGLQEAEIIESALFSIAATKQELASAKAAERDAYQAFVTYLQNYELGTTDLLHVLQAEADFAQNAGQRVQSQAALDAVRITLHRALRTDQFDPEKIYGCNPQLKKGGGDSGFWGWLRDIFHPSSDRVTLDQMCKVARTAPARLD